MADKVPTPEQRQALEYSLGSMRLLEPRLDGHNRPSIEYLYDARSALTRTCGSAPGCAGAKVVQGLVCAAGFDLKRPTRF